MHGPGIPHPSGKTLGLRGIRRPAELPLRGHTHPSPGRRLRQAVYDVIEPRGAWTLRNVAAAVALEQSLAGSGWWDGRADGPVTSGLSAARVKADQPRAAPRAADEPGNEGRTDAPRAADASAADESTLAPGIGVELGLRRGLAAEPGPEGPADPVRRSGQPGDSPPAAALVVRLRLDPAAAQGRDKEGQLHGPWVVFAGCPADNRLWAARRLTLEPGQAELEAELR